MQQDLGAMDRIATILESNYPDIPSPSGYVGRLPSELLQSMYSSSLPPNNPNMVHTTYTRLALYYYMRNNRSLPVNIRDLVLFAMIAKPGSDAVNNYVVQEFIRSSQGQK
jgi:hypothetical protein